MCSLAHIMCGLSVWGVCSQFILLIAATISQVTVNRTFTEAVKVP